MRDPRIAVRLAGLASLLGCPAERVEPEGMGNRLSDDAAPVSRPTVDDPTGPPSLHVWADWPTENVSPAVWFGWRLEPSGQYTRTSGLRLAAASNSYVIAIADGIVRETRLREDGSLDVRVAHGDGTEARYLPLSAALVYAGMPVSRGTVLGLVDGAEITLEVWMGEKEIDPLLVLRSPLKRGPASPP